MAPTLNAERVQAILRDCLYRDDEVPEDGSAPEGAVVVEGVLRKFGLHPGRLKTHEAEVRSMLEELPDSFKVGSGGGMSFLHACNDRHGNQWTDFHRTMDELFVLGQSIGCVWYCLPRDLWGALPGGVPYLTVDLRSDEEKATAEKGGEK